jgi:tetratricopeptide (TPR) repeat protein
MEEKSLNIEQSINYFNKISFETYREWLDSNLILHKNSTLFLYLHLKNFIINNSHILQIQRFIYLEKLFNYALELKLLDESRRILLEFYQNFGKESKILRMESQLAELDDTQRANEFYKKLIISNQEDKVSVKKYIGLLKSSFTLSHEDLKKLIEMWNEYLKIYMDDYEAWYELSDVYLLSSNYSKAVYCLEEVLLHQPNNFNVYTKLGDILCTLNNSEAAVNAVKYYSQSVLIKPTPRAFWGIIAAINVYFRYNKGKDDVGANLAIREKYKTLQKVAKINLENFYAKSPVKFSLEEFYEI